MKVNFLNSLKYSYINLGLIGIKKKTIKDIIRNIENIRKNFFKKSNLNFKINSLLNKCYIENIKILNQVSSDKIFQDICTYSNFFSKLKIKKNYGLVFSNMPERIKKLKKKKEDVTLDPIYSLCARHYINQDNLLKKKLQKYFYFKKNDDFKVINKSYIKILNLRSKLLSENNLLLKKNKLNTGLYKFGWIL